MMFSTYLHKRLVDSLDDRRILVCYDGEGDFKEFCASFEDPNCEILSAVDSILKPHRRKHDH